MMEIIVGDNLDALRGLRAQGRKFSLVELDGPYGENLEEWDAVSESEYIDHYRQRLEIVRDILDPSGVVFLFGWPESCAEIKAWAHRTESLYCRRWLHWYNNQASHAARRIQVVLFFTPAVKNGLFPEFREWMKAARKSRGMTIKDCMLATGIHAKYADISAGGYQWFEADSSDIPTRAEYQILKSYFNIPDKFDPLPASQSYKGLTDVDMLHVNIETAVHLNDNGLRSKPLGLYRRLFEPTRQPGDGRRALILYGGSGNAGIVAGSLGYHVTYCEQDQKRADNIVARHESEVARLARIIVPSTAESAVVVPRSSAADKPANGRVLEPAQMSLRL